MIQTKQLKETESIISIRSIRKLKEFLNVLMKTKKPEFHQEMMSTKEVKWIFWEIMINKLMSEILQELL